MIYTTLFDWQKKLIDTYKDREAFGLFLDMGLGKTPLSLAFAEANNCSKIIIITPNSKALETENNKYSFLWWATKFDKKFNFYTKKDEINLTNETNDILLINYESLFSRITEKKLENNKIHKKLPSIILNDKVKDFIKSCKNCNVSIIVDESHKMKNSDSKQTKSIKLIKKELLLKHSNVYCYLLSGTPFTSEYIDLYTQLSFLGMNMTKGEFKEKFCITGNIPGLLGWQQPIVGYKNLNKFYDLVHNYSITIKSNAVIELPKQVFIYHKIDISNDFKYLINEKLSALEIKKRLDEYSIEYDKNLYQNSKKLINPFYKNLDYPKFNWLCETAGQFYLRCRQISIGFQGNEDNYTFYNKNRINKLKEFLKENRDNYILFYNFTPELFELYQLCEELNYNIDVYCGDIKSEYFYEQYQNLDEGKKLINKNNIMLVNFQSGSASKNWQEYNKCIIFSLPTYGNYSQALKRIHRIGQKETVFYHIFYENNFLDNSMLNSLKEKKEYDEKLFESDLKKNLIEG